MLRYAPVSEGLLTVLNAAHRLFTLTLVSAAGIHSTIALDLWLNRNPILPTVSQGLLYRYIPDEVWPVLFAVCGITAFFGMWHLRIAQIHFSLAGFLTLAFSIVALSIPASPIIRTGGLIFLHIALLKFAFAYYTPKLAKVHRAAVRVIEEVGLVQEQLASEDSAGGK